MFKLYHSKGVVNNSFVNDVYPGTSLDTDAELINGKAVVITSGLLETAATNGSIAGILAIEPGTVNFGNDEQGNPIGGPAKGVTELPLWMPVGRETLIEADAASAGTVTIGTAYDLEDGLTLDLVNAIVNGDFKVLKVLEGVDGGDGTWTAVTKVAGVFTDTTGYFA